MQNNLMFVGSFAMLLALFSCGDGKQKNMATQNAVTEAEQAKRVVKYYNTSLILLDNVIEEKDVNSILGYMEQEDNAPMLTAVVPPVFSQKDSAFVVNPGIYFNEETRSNLKLNYMQLFQTRKRFYANFNQFLSYVKENNRVDAEKLLPLNYQLSVEMSEYKENILDILSPFIDDAHRILLNDNPMKEQVISMKRITATMESILTLCMRKPTPDIARLDMKMMKLVIQLDIATRLPAVEGHPKEMKAYQDFLTNVEAFVTDVQRVKAQGTYTNAEIAALEEYGMEEPNSILLPDASSAKPLHTSK